MPSNVLPTRRFRHVVGPLVPLRAPARRPRVAGGGSSAPTLVARGTPSAGVSFAANAAACTLRPGPSPGVIRLKTPRTLTVVARATTSPPAAGVAKASSANDVATVPAIPLEGVAMGAATKAIVPGSLDKARQGRPATVGTACSPALGAHVARLTVLVKSVVA